MLAHDRRQARSGVFLILLFVAWFKNEFEEGPALTGLQIFWMVGSRTRRMSFPSLAVSAASHLCRQFPGAREHEQVWHRPHEALIIGIRRICRSLGLSWPCQRKKSVIDAAQRQGAKVLNSIQRRERHVSLLVLPVRLG